MSIAPRVVHAEVDTPAAQESGQQGQAQQS
jgi:hypothetical protein